MTANDRPTVIHVVHSLDGGGTERVLLALLQSLDHSEMRHVVVTLRQAGSLAGRLPDFVPCFALGASGRDRMAGLRLARVARKVHANIIHARNVCCWFDAVVAKVMSPRAQLVLGFHGLESEDQLSRQACLVAKGALSIGGRIASVSLCGRAMLARQLGTAGESIIHLPNGIENSKVVDNSGEQRARMRRSLGFAENDRVIGSVGSLTPVKGYDVLLESFASLARLNDQFRLLLVGDGPVRARLLEDAMALGVFDRVRFAGHSNDVPAMLSAMDAYVCSSRSEGMNNALLEAMAGGLPIVATSVGDNAVMIRDRIDGILVGPNDAAAMYSAIRCIFEDPGERARLASTARNRSREFGYRKCVANYDRLYRDLLAARGPARSAYGKPVCA